MVNTLAEKLTLYWVDDTIEERRLLDVPPLGEVPQQTFVGHVFVARKAQADDKGRLVDWWTMDGYRQGLKSALFCCGSEGFSCNSYGRELGARERGQLPVES